MSELNLAFKIILHLLSHELDTELRYVGLPRDHAESYHSFMWENFFKHIDIEPANVHILDGNAPNLQIECEAYEKKIHSHGGIELFLAGKQPLLARYGFDHHPHSLLNQVSDRMVISRSTSPGRLLSAAPV